MVLFGLELHLAQRPRNEDSFVEVFLRDNMCKYSARGRGVLIDWCRT
jgi:hypothetical protein